MCVICLSFLSFSSSKLERKTWEDGEEEEDKKESFSREEGNLVFKLVARHVSMPLPPLSLKKWREERMRDESLVL